MRIAGTVRCHGRLREWNFARFGRMAACTWLYIRKNVRRQQRPLIAAVKFRAEDERKELTKWLPQDCTFDWKRGQEKKRMSKFSFATACRLSGPSLTRRHGSQFAWVRQHSASLMSSRMRRAGRRIFRAGSPP